MKKLKPYFLILLFIIGIEQYCNAQQSDFIHLDKNNGLSNNFVSSINQDSKGFLWVSTYLGLCRFDGQSFKNFYKSKNENGISDDRFHQCKNVGNDELALCTADGASIFNMQTFMCKKLNFPTSDSIHYWSYSIKDMAKDKAGNYGVAAGTGFFIFNTAGKLINSYEGNTTEEVLAGAIRFSVKLFTDSKGNLILWHKKGFTTYDWQKNKFENTNSTYKCFNTLSQIQSKHITQISNDKLFYVDYKKLTINVISISNEKLISSKISDTISLRIFWNSALKKINDTTFILNCAEGFYYLHYNEKNNSIRLNTQLQFEKHYCFTSFLDKEKKIWIGSNNGLYKLNNTKKIIENFDITENNKGTSVSINAIAVDKENIYAGGKDNRLLVLDKRTIKLKKTISFSTFHSTNNFITYIFKKSEDTLWIASNYSPLWVNTKNYTVGKLKFANNNNVLDSTRTEYIYKDSEGDYWFAAVEENAVFRFKESTGVLERINSSPVIKLQGVLYQSKIAEDINHNIWISADAAIRWNRKKGYIDSIIHRLPNQQGFAKGFWVMPDSKGNDWVTTNNDGWHKFSSTSNIILRDKNLQPSNCSDLFNNYIYSRTINNEIAVINTINNEYYLLKENDGLPKDNITTQNFYYDNDLHKIWFANRNIISSFNEASNKNQSVTYPLIITSLEVINDTTFIYPSNEITLTYTQNNIRLNFSSLNYNDRNNTDFFYRIKSNKDTNWIYLETPELLLTNISYGNYLIQLKTTSKNNIWVGQMKEINIHILPPIWKRWWFVLLYIVGIGYFIYAFIKWREKNRELVNQEKLKVQQLGAEQFKNKLELEQIVNYFSSSLIDKITVDTVLWDVAKNLIGKFGFEDCMIYLWNEDKTKMVQQAGYGPKGSIEEITKNIFDVMPGQGIVGYVMQTKESVLIANTLIDPRYRVDEMMRYSEIAVPIIYNDELIGIIDSEHPEKNFFTEQHLTLMGTIATLMANKIKSIEADHALQNTKMEMLGISEKLSKTKLEALRSQMNPHFIFNCLNSIKRMILENDNENASKYLSKFSQLVRLSLHHSQNEMICIKDNVEHLALYLDMEQLRFKNKFEYKILIDENIEPTEITIPSLILQPIAENAIWHGLQKKEGRKEIIVSFRNIHGSLICAVEDNGIGYKQSLLLKGNEQLITHKSYGMQNINERLKITSIRQHVECHLEIISNTPEHLGTYVAIHFNDIEKLRDYE